ncbi:MAG: NAD(P)-dependent oxidoreductase [Planctomycetota bacterium]|nr:MAG: NAD(P)-dependent oxidoreductase [Planctomycetota bacterium]
MRAERRLPTGSGRECPVGSRRDPWSNAGLRIRRDRGELAVRAPASASDSDAASLLAWAENRQVRRVSGLRIALTGASGLAGRAVSAALLRAGHHVRALRHRAPLPGGLEASVGALGDAASHQRLVADRDVLVHLAAIQSGTHEELRRINFDATVALAEAARAAGLARCVFISSSSVYAPGSFRDATETHRVGPELPYAISKLAAEQALRERLGGALTVLRPVSLVHSGPCAFFDGLRALVELELPDVDGSRTPIDLLHVDDLASAVCAAASGAGSGGMFHLAGASPPEFRELAEWTAQPRGIALRWRACPPAAPAEFPHWLYEAAAVPRTLSIAAARAALGFDPRADLRAALGAALRAGPS